MGKTRTDLPLLTTNTKQKETVYAYLKKSRVPYTIIDIGVWHEVAIPRVTSGKLDRAALMGRTFLVGEKETRCATTAVVLLPRLLLTHAR